MGRAVARPIILMRLNSFPEIEDFRKLPREVVVKGAISETSLEKGVEIRGIVINNLGQAIKNIRVQVVVFDEYHLPQMSTGISPSPAKLQQGGIANFIFTFQGLEKPVKDFYLHANWGFDTGEPEEDEEEEEAASES
ncbi:MAG TPA: hypothetical protein PLY88_08585 [Candidatus Omnitrophota bacterium]|nr:hypothetical protein [Candidatus Omnitrophota bacterium]